MTHDAEWTLEDTCRHAVLCWLATVDAAGQPSVSPKEIWHRDGDSFCIADIASAGSIRAIRVNPRVCVSLIDVFRERGHKLMGAAEIVESGAPEFAARAAPLRDLAGPDFPIRNVIVLRIERAVPIIAPSWRIFPERDADEHVRRSLETYGVRPR
ncbi:Pyridoxamine 5'-phosphate oxidase [Roseivivax jejudonensis]|uniref:Pyridoxamine 5'-phosphate oxidase n=1 Tax=Roseivivax jejudonensis TaxID=1529041 RepID=A0A1X6ZXM8_9RHOB|nr:pyridoxamine 5'-phosphate oxidase family protein [Roseivivax jejudonensis]SLN64442.1 Pyridoxamine 5'-phosphate oxidase [Roseivivax jejudonensis]